MFGFVRRYLIFMDLFKHSTAFEGALSITRFDLQHPLSTASVFPFVLEQRTWPTAEHYYQSQKFVGAYRERVAAAESAEQAYRLGNRWFKRKRPDFKSVKRVLMTRALYSKAQQNPVVREALLQSGEQQIIETSLYDHYWGLGRDQRGENMLGKVWMDIRRKLRQEQNADAVASDSAQHRE